MRYGTVPAEVPVQSSLELLAPNFRDRLLAMLADPVLAGGLTEWPFETVRSAPRQHYLYGFGRDYDDGRGIVTRAESALASWHGYGLAVDIVAKTADPWDAPAIFWSNLGVACDRHQLTWGGRWVHADLPHVQWRACPVSPSDADRDLFAEQGMLGVWRKYGAVPV